VAAAAQTYFNKTLDQLTPGEAAYLAALPKAPGKGLRPVQEYDRAVERRNYVLREMWQNGYIDEATYEAEKALPLLTVRPAIIPATARRCRRAAISPRKSPASCRRTSARKNSSTAA
jgi:penicillin-binding protein 1A